MSSGVVFSQVVNPPKPILALGMRDSHVDYLVDMDRFGVNVAEMLMGHWRCYIVMRVEFL
jgi:hypothetical protein